MQQCNGAGSTDVRRNLDVPDPVELTCDRSDLEFGVSLEGPSAQLIGELGSISFQAVTR
jgi:hypothetical protein